MDVKNNPLKGYFRQYKAYIKLPSAGGYYNKNTLTLNESGEVGILPMTGKDELMLKNPDALLNGEALVEVISSCVPAVKNPRQLLSNDIDALITAIKAVTFDDKIETEAACPSCGHSNSFKVNMNHSLDNMSYLDPEYVVNLPNGLSVFVKPYGFNEVIAGFHAQFEQSKIAKNLNNDSKTDEEKIKILGTSLKELTIVTYRLIASSVIKIVDESKNINVDNPAFIKDFLNNAEKSDIDLISDTITKINKIGIQRTFFASCEKCKHEWTTEMDFNPVNFS